MSEILEFDYFYGIEADQFTFFRIPKLLIKDERFKGLSSDAKLLYGLMLDRMGLSRKNGWIDEADKVYIRYTIEDVAEDLGRSKPTCTKILQELDSEKGIGLIEKVHKGLGQPDVIYVKNFATIPECKPEKKAENTDESTEIKNFNVKESNNLIPRDKEILSPEIKEFSPQESKILVARDKEFLSPEIKDFIPNNTYTNQTDFNQTDNNQIKSNHISTVPDGYDAMDEAKAYMDLIRENLDYDILISRASRDEREMLEEIYNIICDVVCVKRKTIKVNGEDYPYEIVKNVFLKLNSSHIEYVAGCLKDTNTKVTNIRQYLITTLYNAPITISHYYQQEVQHDMYGGGWNEKGVI